MFTFKNVSVGFCAMTLIAASQPPLTGEWGGDRARLTLTATGGRIDYDCGSGTIKGPLRLDAKSRFKANGDHEEYSPGPVSGDAKRVLHPTVYRGSLHADTITLVVQVSGEPKPRTLTLVRGKRIKLIRCY